MSAEMGPRVAGHSYYRGRGTIAQRGTAGAATAVPTRGSVADNHACCPCGQRRHGPQYLPRAEPPEPPQPPATAAQPASARPPPGDSSAHRLSALRQRRHGPQYLPRAEPPEPPTTPGDRRSASFRPAPTLRLLGASFVGLAPTAPWPAVSAEGRAPGTPTMAGRPGSASFYAGPRPRLNSPGALPARNCRTAGSPFAHETCAETGTAARVA